MLQIKQVGRCRRGWDCEWTESYPLYIIPSLGLFLFYLYHVSASLASVVYFVTHFFIYRYDSVFIYVFLPGPIAVHVVSILLLLPF